MPVADPDGYEGELASSILLDDGDGAFGAGYASPFAGYPAPGPPTGGSAAGQAAGQRPGRPSGSPGGSPGSSRAQGGAGGARAPQRSPARTPSPVGVYHWGHGQAGLPAGAGGRHTGGWPAGKSSSSTSTGVDPAQAYGMPCNPMFPSQWPMSEAYYSMLAGGPGGLAAAGSGGADASGGEGQGEDGGAGGDALNAMGPSYMWQQQMMMQQQQMMMAAAMQAECMGGAAVAHGFSASGVGGLDVGVSDHSAGWTGDGKGRKPRGKERDAAPRPAAGAAGGLCGSDAQPRARGQTGEGGGGAKSGMRRVGGGGTPAGGGEERPGGGGHGRGGKSRPSSSPIVEQLKAKKVQGDIDLGSLAPHIAEIALDQYGSRLIQQKLEVASDEEKQQAFASVIQSMPQLTQDVFGNYVIQKFFEHGTPEQRRVLAEQLLGKVLQLSMQMYGCRVVQKALDWVPIEQQVLLIGELKEHVLSCIEDQHGNHVIQKCIERLPTDRIGFIVDSFQGQACRMAKHCYGCRVIQRLIEFCASHQISALLDEVLFASTDLSEDQYGNYVVQHVMEHSSRPGDRHTIMLNVRQNVLKLSCHKYASNVVEKVLACGTMEERSALIYAIIGEQGGPHSPLLTMMNHKFGNYIVQRVIQVAAGPQKNALLWKLHDQMSTLKKPNTYGKHILSALEQAQNAGTSAGRS